MNTLAESLEIGVGSALLGAVVGAIAGYALSRHQLSQIEAAHRATAEGKAALTAGTFLLAADTWVKALPATASALTNPEGQLQTIGLREEARSVSVVAAMLDLSSPVRETAFLKLAQLAAVSSAVDIARAYALTKLASESGLAKIVWDAAHAEDPGFVVHYELVRVARDTFLKGLTDLIDQLARKGQVYLDATRAETGQEGKG